MGSESDTVNSLTRLPMYFYSGPSRIIVATLPGSPWHSYHQKYRVGKPARAQKSVRSPPLARYPLARSRELLSSVKLLNRMFFPSRVKSDSWERLDVENSFPRTTFLTLIKKHSGSTWYLAPSGHLCSFKTKRKTIGVIFLKVVFLTLVETSSHLNSVYKNTSFKSHLL